MANTIKLSRVKRGWTQTELGERTGIVQERVSLLERGLKPKPNEIKKIIKAFGLRGKDSV